MSNQLIFAYNIQYVKKGNNQGFVIFKEGFKEQRALN